jgi:molybdopterin molybdotransferase
MSGHDLLPIDQALAAVLAQTSTLPAEIVALELGLGRVLAADLTADRPQPAFDRSAMDGVALRCADWQPGAWMPQQGQILAGKPWDGALLPGHCLRIMTGAQVPDGADAVVPVEKIEVDLRLGQDGAQQTWVRLAEAPKREQHIARMGCEVQENQAVLKAGQRLTPARLGVAASFGHAALPVVRRPIVALVPTGDELVAVDVLPGPGQIRDSNRYAIAALLAADAEVLHFAPARDQPDALRLALEQAWAHADVLVTIGGVSAGDADLVAPTLLALGAHSHFHKIRIKPGKPLLFATQGRKLAFGLPGNPLAAMVGAALFVKPALARLQGEAFERWPQLQLPVASALPGVGPRDEVYACSLTDLGAVQIHGNRGSADLPAFAQGTWLALRRAGSPALQAGELVTVLPQ